MLLIKLLPESHLVRVQSSVTLNDSEPEPDLAVAIGPSQQFVEEHPGPRDLALVIEVADSSLAQDRGLKQRVYARARIPIYWIVNLVEGQVEVYSSPRAGKSPGYREHRDYTGRQTVAVLIGGTEIGAIRVAEMLP